MKGLVFTFFVVFYVQLYASYDQGVKAFMDNDYKGAVSFFKTSVETQDHVAESYLYLAIISKHLGQEDQAFEYLNQFYSKAEYPDPYIYAIYYSGVIGSGGKKNKSELALLNTIANNPKSYGTSYLLAESGLGNHYYYANDVKNARLHFGQMKVIDQWRILGEFDNYSGGGFNKDFKAVSCPGPDCLFENKAKAEIKWFDIPTLNYNAWLDFDYHFLTNDAINYAQTFFTVPVDQEVYVRLGVSGSLKCWIDDQLIFSEQEERNVHADVYTVKVTIPKGQHRLLVQVGSSDIDNNNVMVRLTDEKGYSLPNIIYSKKVLEYSLTTSLKPQVIPHFAEIFFQEKIKSDDQDLLSRIMLLHIYEINEKLHEARDVLSLTKPMAPDNTYLSILSAGIYAREKNTIEYTRVQESIKAKDPNSLYALSLQIEDDIKNAKFEDATKHVKLMEDLYGNLLSVELFKLSLLGKKSSYDEFLKDIDRLYLKYPDNADIVSAKYLTETSIHKSTEKSSKILEKYLKTNHNYNFYSQLAENYIAQNQHSKGYKIYEDLVLKNPVSVGTHVDLVKTYFSNQSYSKALIHAEAALKLAPYVSSYWDMKGRIHHSMNDLPKAKESLQRSVYLSPTNYSARQTLRILDEKKDLFDYFQTYNIDSLYQVSPSSSQYPEDHSLIIVNDEQRIFYPEGASETKGEVLIKVFNQTGIDSWKEYSVGYNPYNQSLNIEKAEILKKDGSKVKAEKNDDYIVFTGLEVGDAVHVLYRIENYTHGKLAQHFNDKFHFNYFFPSLQSRYSIIIPKNKAFYKNIQGENIDYKTQEVEDYVLHTWASYNEPGIKDEPAMPNLGDIGKTLEVTTIQDWNFVVDWYSDLSESRAKLDYDVKDVLQQILTGFENASALEKAKKIYEYIVTNITYSSVSFLHGAYVPQKASTTLNSRMGDCKDVSTLFVTMAREAGLNTNLVLVDTRKNGQRDMTVPSIRFNHCIAQLNDQGKSYFVELTSQKSSFNTLSDELDQALILPIPLGGTTQEKVFTLGSLHSKTNVLNASIRKAQVSFKDYDMLVVKNSVRTGQEAAAMRYAYADVGEENQQKSLLESISGDYSTPVNLLDHSFEDLKTLTDTVKYDYTYSVKNHLKDFSNMKIFTLPWVYSYKMNEYFSKESRTYPLLLWALIDLDLEQESMEIQIPKGYTLTELPKSQSFSCPNAKFSIDFKVQNNVLYVKKSFEMLKDIIDIDEYDEAKQFFTMINEIHQQQIGFKKL